MAQRFRKPRPAHKTPIRTGALLHIMIHILTIGTHRPLVAEVILRWDVQVFGFVEIGVGNCSRRQR